jgi:hypothetical protein
VTNQHRVEFPDCVLTRLPVGEAEGRLWLFFVVTGLPLSRFDPQDTDSPWRLRDHVAVRADGVEVAIEGSGGSGSDRLTLEHMQIRKPDTASISIEYVFEDRLIDAETFDLDR